MLLQPVDTDYPFFLQLGSNYAGGVVRKYSPVTRTRRPTDQCVSTAQMAAATEGYQQILWLFGEDHQLTEVGTVSSASLST